MALRFDTLPGGAWTVTFDIVFIALLVGAGVLLIAKGKLGLWLLALLGAFVASGFLRQLLRLRFSSSRDEVYATLFEAIFLWLAWLVVGSYYYRRRAQFVGWWRTAKKRPEEYLKIR